jgi:peptide/nickel transport system permease protein
VLGASDGRVLALHILPNIAGPIIVIVSVLIGIAILVEAALAFLGLGVPPPRPSWGQMLSVEGYPYMLQQPWLAVWPGAAISLVVLGTNLLGDALRDLLDPRLRSRGAHSG